MILFKVISIITTSNSHVRIQLLLCSILLLLFPSVTMLQENYHEASHLSASLNMEGSWKIPNLSQAKSWVKSAKSKK